MVFNHLIPLVHPLYSQTLQADNHNEEREMIFLQMLFNIIIFFFDFLDHLASSATVTVIQFWIQSFSGAMFCVQK